MTKAEKDRVMVYEAADGQGQFIGFIERQSDGQWRAWDTILSWGPMATQELAASAVRASFKARQTEYEMKRLGRGQRL